MKPPLKRLLLLVLVCLCTQSYAQLITYPDYDLDDSTLYMDFPVYIPDHISTISHCERPYITNFAAVKYDGLYGVYLELDNWTDGQLFLYENDASVPIDLYPIDQGRLVKGLSHTKAYEIKAYNQCEELVSLGAYNGADLFESTDNLIQVPDDMYELAVAFGIQQENPLPLAEFLTQDESVAFMVKLGFYQKYALNNGDLPFSAIDGKIIPDYTTYVTWGYPHPRPNPDNDPNDPGEPGGESDCRCDYISTTANSNHGQPHATGQYRIYDARQIQYNPGWPDKIKTGNDAHHWYQTTALGVAKWQDSHASAWKAKKGIYHGTFHSSGRSLSDDQKMIRSSLKLVLVCNDGNQLPAECACDKRVLLDWAYDSDAEVLANTHSGGGGTKRAVAAAEDQFIVYCMERDRVKTNGKATIHDFQILDALYYRVSAECHLEVNSDFWRNWADLIVEVLGIVDDPGSILSDSLRQRNFLTELEDVITDTYYEPGACDRGGSRTGAGASHGSFEATLRPNEEVTFVMSTAANTMARGMRSFYSYARVNSDGWMTCIANPGPLEGESQQCCTPWVATYFGATLYPDPRMDKIRDLMGNQLHSYNMQTCLKDGQSAGYGGGCSMPARNAECTVDVIHSQRSDQLITAKEEQQLISAQVYSLDGRLVISRSIHEIVPSLDNEYRILQACKAHLPDLSAGTYVLRVQTDDHQIKVMKFPIINE